VLYVEPATKEVGLSLLPHLLSLTLPSATPMLGQVRLVSSALVAGVLRSCAVKCSSEVLEYEPVRHSLHCKLQCIETVEPAYVYIIEMPL
jgi:hypothetical protein